MKAGVYSDLSSEDYHSYKDSISRSALMDFARSPYHYWSKHLNADKPIEHPTRAMELGTAFHLLILEPKLFESNYALMPIKVLLKDVGREKYEAYKKEIEAIEYSGRKSLELEEYLNLMSMKHKLESKPEAIQLIQNARIEHSFFWEDPHSGLLLKCRPDILHENIIVDLKTCSDASPRGFQNSMITGGYHLQGAMIRDAVEILGGNRINTVINVCIETKYPYAMGIYIIDELALDEGERKYKQLCLDLKAAREKNEFNDYGIQQIGLPPWAK